ncbi:hypothetical protein MKX03_028933 [Papaver bracteatum]|nr:hypothetical protein MKX03_028933 [Papaver bracteatum]
MDESRVLDLEEGLEIIQNGFTKKINIFEGMLDESPKNQGVLELEEGWEFIQYGITKLINILAGVPYESPIDGSFMMEMYSTIYTMCTQKPPADYSKQLYERYQGVYNYYLQSIVLPAIREKHDDVSMLQELVKRWENHKVMVKKLSQCFYYLDRDYIYRKGLPTLKAVGFNCFDKIVGEEMKVRVKDAANRVRQGEEIDQTLLKNVLEILDGNTQNREDILLVAAAEVQPHFPKLL